MDFISHTLSLQSMPVTVMSGPEQTVAILDLG